MSSLMSLLAQLAPFLSTISLKVLNKQFETKECNQSHDIYELN